ncbi:MAG: hypothetical protein ABI888_04760 [Chloroflexota bacterium]
MAAQDDLLAHTPEIQDALRHSLQESGAAGTGPVQLPPPADFTSEQSHSPASTDPLSYSNTLKVQLYRDAEGKVWTQPGPGHESSDLEMRIRKVNGKWHVVTEVSHVAWTVKRKGHTYTTIRTDAISTSGAPTDYQLPSDQGHGWDETDRAGRAVTPSEVRNRERFEDFSPTDAKTAMRQAITKLQQKGAIYAPTVPGPSGNASNALFAAAAIAALAAAAAFAGIGPFATQAAAAPVPAPTATAVPSAAKTLVAPVKLTGSGSIAFALPARYGTGSTITDYLCQNTFLPPVTSGAAEEPAMGVRGLLNGETYTALFTATRTSVIFQNVSRTPALFGPAPSTFILGQRAAGTVAVQTSPQTNPSSAGTLTIDLACLGGAVATPTTAGVAVAPIISVSAASAPTAPAGPSPWGPGLAALAAAAAGAGFATKARIGPQATVGKASALTRQDSPAPPSCQHLVTAETRLVEAVARRKELGFDLLVGEDRRPGSEVQAEIRQLVGVEVDLDRVREALRRCRAGEGPDVVPALRSRFTPVAELATLGKALAEEDWAEKGFEPIMPRDAAYDIYHDGDNRAPDSDDDGFDPVPPPSTQAGDDEPKGREKIE